MSESTPDDVDQVVRESRWEMVSAIRHTTTAGQLLDKVMRAKRKELAAAQRSAARAGHQLDEALGVAAEVADSPTGVVDAAGMGADLE